MQAKEIVNQFEIKNFFKKEMLKNEWVKRFKRNFNASSRQRSKIWEISHINIKITEESNDIGWKLQYPQTRWKLLNLYKNTETTIHLTKIWKKKLSRKTVSLPIST